MDYKVLLSDIINSNVNKIVFVLELSNHCPMGCKYCFYKYDLKNKKNLDLNNKELFKFIKNIAKYKLVNIDIQYDGNFNLLKNFLFKLYDSDLYHIKTTIQSSGLGVNDKFLDLISDFNISVAYSFDGFFTGFRKNLVAKSAMDLTNKYKIPFGVITVVSKENDSRLFEDFKNLVKSYPETFSGIYYNYIYTSNLNMLPNANNVVDEYNFIFKYIVKNNLKINFSPYLLNIKRKFFKFAELCDDGGCGAYKRMYAINCEGKIYGCDSLINAFDVTNDIKKNRRYILKDVKKYRSLLGCDNCEYKSICETFCIGKFKCTNNDVKFLKELCSYNKKVSSAVSNILQDKGLCSVFISNPNKGCVKPVSSNIKNITDLTKDNFAYMKRSTVNLKNNLVDSGFSKILQILNNFSEIYYPLFLDKDKLKYRFVKNYSFVRIISESRCNCINKRNIKKLFFSEKLFYNLIVELNYFYNKVNFLLNTFNLSDGDFFNLFNNFINYKSRFFYIKDIVDLIIFDELIKYKKDNVIKNSLENYNVIFTKLCVLINRVGYPLNINFDKFKYVSLNLKLNPILDYFYYYKIGYYSNIFDKSKYNIIINSELKDYSEYNKYL
jgi:radical SAM protein with 4Fe4S-binding SPASM domain